MVRLLDADHNFLSWIPEVEAKDLISFGSYDEVYTTSTTRRNGTVHSFLGIKPAAAVPKHNIFDYAPTSLTDKEAEINAGLYPGHGGEAENYVSKGRYLHVRSKVRSFRRASWSDRVVCSSPGRARSSSPSPSS